MESKKFTKGEWKTSTIHGVCIGVEVDLGGGYSQMIVNTILPETDKQYAKEKTEIIANAQLIAAAPALLEALQGLMHRHEESIGFYDGNFDVEKEEEFIQAKAAITAALGKKGGDGE